MSFERSCDLLTLPRVTNRMSWRFRLGALIVGVGYGAFCEAHSSSPVHITNAEFNPGSDAITISGKLDCSDTSLKGPIDIIATVEQELGQTNALVLDESFEPYAIGITVTDGCREGRTQKWSVSVGALNRKAFHSGSKVHCAVTLSPRETRKGDLQLISAETDRRLVGG